jgi:teichuronic acid exporter
MDLKQKVLSGLGWSAGGRFLGQLITWAITIIVMRLLTPGDYGLMGMAGVFIAFLALLNELGLGAALIQMQEVDETTLRQTIGISLMINFCLFLILLLIAPLIGSFFNEQRVIPIVRLLSIQFIIMPFIIIPQSMLIRTMDFKKLSMVDFVSAIAGSATTLILALIGLEVWSLVLGSLVITLSRTIGLNFLSSCILVPSFSMRAMGQIISFGSYVTINRVLWCFYTQADMFIIGKILGNELLGFYSVGKQLASLPMEKVSGILNQVAFPAYSTIQKDLEKTRSHFLKAERLISFVSFPISWGISVIAPQLMAVLFGNKWLLAVLPIQLISLVIPIQMIHLQIDPLVMGMGCPYISSKNVSLASIVMPLAILAGTHWSLTGVCVAWIILFPVVFLCNMWRLVKVLKLSFINLLLPMVRPAITALIMCIAIESMKSFLHSSEKSIGQLIILIFWGGIVYGMVVRIIFRDGYREVIGLLNQIYRLKRK